jgi:hypothetical protein
LFQQHKQDLESLPSKPEPYAVLPQFSRANVKIEQAKSVADCRRIGLIHETERLGRHQAL